MVDENEDAEHIHITQSQLEVIPTLRWPLFFQQGFTNTTTPALQGLRV